MNSKTMDWNMRQHVSFRIVAQLKPMSEEQKRVFIGKLLEHLDPEFIQALEFAYEMVPEGESEKTNDH